MLSLSACISRKQIKAYAFLNNAEALPRAYCGTKEVPGPIYNYGFYRKLNDGKLEFISFCDPDLPKRFISFDQNDIDAILEGQVPKP